MPSFHSSARGTGRPARPLRRLLMLLALLPVLSGCISMGTDGRRHWTLPGRLGAGDRVARERSIDHIGGPLLRSLQGNRQDEQSDSVVDKEDRRRLDEAKRQLEDGRLQNNSDLIEDAADEFQALTKKRNPKRFEWFRPGGRDETPLFDPIREEALFLYAEAAYVQNRLPQAVEHYQALIKDYPSTRYLDQSTRRLFDISKRWLEMDDFATSGEIRQVSVDDPDRKDQPLSDKEAAARPRRWAPNLTDKSRPVVDTSGHAIEALKTIWLNDPSGPLADDALMLASTFHLRTGNYQESDRLLTILREQFPRSTHLQTAFVIGSHVKLMSYQGAAYEEEQLEDARKLKESTLRLFPDAPEADRIRKELATIEEARARRIWERVVLYERKGRPKAVGVLCRELLTDFPNSPWAGPARDKLAELGDAALPSLTPTPTTGDRLKSLLDQPLRPFRSESEPAEEDGPVFENTDPDPDPETPPFEPAPLNDPRPIEPAPQSQPAEPRTFTPDGGRPARETISSPTVGRARL